MDSPLFKTRNEGIPICTHHCSQKCTPVFKKINEEKREIAKNEKIKKVKNINVFCFFKSQSWSLSFR